MANSPKSSSNPDEIPRNPVSAAGGGGSNGHGGDSRLDSLEHNFMLMLKDINVMKERLATIEERLEHIPTKHEMSEMIEKKLDERLSHMPTKFDMVMIMGSMIFATIVGSGILVSIVDYILS